MKLVRYNEDATGILMKGDQPAAVIDIAESLPALAAAEPRAASVLHSLFRETPASWIPMIENWEHACPALRSLQSVAEAGTPGLVSRPLADVTLRPPLPEPSTRIFANGGNFADHVAGAATGIRVKLESGIPPWGFFVIPGTVVGTNAPITPPAWVQKLDYEGEVAVVLARGGSSIAADEVELWGYTAWSDFSIRDGALGLTKSDPGPILNWALGKNWATGNACGPWMVVDDRLVGADLTLSLQVNGEQRQASSTGNMMHSFGDVAAWLSGYLPLRPGDMIVSGTPAGTAMESGADGPYLRNGDVIEVFVEGLDMGLRNQIRR
jgi:2-keto-4-pentenoate hydratase/2-oxohepta-3-ene-1,7-dioic acid hydratase in catechol pathway